MKLSWKLRVGSQVAASRAYSKVSYKTSKEFDYVIIGAGSAGCVLAHRLSNAKQSVCLLEAGKAGFNWMTRIPGNAILTVNNKRINWNYQTVPQTQLHNQPVDWPRGKTLGGSSTINAMVC